MSKPPLFNPDVWQKVNMTKQQLLDIYPMNKRDDNASLDTEWLRSMSDEDLSKWATQLSDSSTFARKMIVDLRDAVLGVLVKHHVCPAHWVVDGCPLEVYGRNKKIGGKYESDLNRSRKLNHVLMRRIKELEKKVDERWVDGKDE